MHRPLSTSPSFPIACHEAGHAVVAHCLEIPILRITLTKSDHSASGEMQYDDRFAKLEHIGAALLAGDYAQFHLVGHTRGDSSGDAEQLESLCLTKIAMHRAELVAERLVKENANRIWHLAKVLDFAEELHGDRLQKLLLSDHSSRLMTKVADYTIDPLHKLLHVVGENSFYDYRLAKVIDY